MKVQTAAPLVNIRIAGVFVFCALIVRLNIRNFRSLILCKAENRKLWLTHLFLPPFLPDQFITQRVGKLDDLFIADALPLQLGGQIGNAVRPAIFIMYCRRKAFAATLCPVAEHAANPFPASAGSKGITH